MWPLFSLCFTCPVWEEDVSFLPFFPLWTASSLGQRLLLVWAPSAPNTARPRGDCTTQGKEEFDAGNAVTMWVSEETIIRAALSFHKGVSSCFTERRILGRDDVGHVESQIPRKS